MIAPSRQLQFDARLREIVAATDRFIDHAAAIVVFRSLMGVGALASMPTTRPCDIGVDADAPIQNVPG
jgi:hypothetical protein